MASRARSVRHSLFAVPPQIRLEVLEAVQNARRTLRMPAVACSGLFGLISSHMACDLPSVQPSAYVIKTALRLGRDTLFCDVPMSEWFNCLATGVREGVVCRSRRCCRVDRQERGTCACRSSFAVTSRESWPWHLAFQTVLCALCFNSHQTSTSY